VDYTHAFDSVYRNKLIECLKIFDVPDKLIRLIALTLIQTRARVKINRGVKENWSGRTGVAVLPRGDIGGPQGFSVTLQGCKVRNTVLFTQDRLCIVKSHIPPEVTLLRRTQWI